MRPKTFFVFALSCACAFVMLNGSAKGQFAPFGIHIDWLIRQDVEKKSKRNFERASVAAGYVDAIDYMAGQHESLRYFTRCIERRGWPDDWPDLNDEEIDALNRPILESFDKAAKSAKGKIYVESMSVTYFMVLYSMELYFCDTALHALAQKEPEIEGLTSPRSYSVPPIAHVDLEMEGQLFGKSKDFVLQTGALSYVDSLIYAFSVLQHIGLLSARFCMPYTEEGLTMLRFDVEYALRELPPDRDKDLRDLVVAELERFAPCEEERREGAQ